MFDAIVLAMRKSLNYTTLDVQRLGSNKHLRDIIKCTSLGRITENQIDDAMYFSRQVKEGISVMYVFITSAVTEEKDRLDYDIIDRDGNTIIVIYRYSDFPEDDGLIIERLLRETETIMQSIYGYLYLATAFGKEKAPFDKFKHFSSRQKMLLLSPYIIVCKIFEGVNIGLHTGGNFTFQKAINPNGIEAVDKVVNFILKENPTTDTLFNLNAFLLPFGPHAE